MMSTLLRFSNLISKYMAVLVIIIAATYYHRISTIANYFAGGNKDVRQGNLQLTPEAE